MINFVQTSCSCTTCACSFEKQKDFNAFLAGQDFTFSFAKGLTSVKGYLECLDVGFLDVDYLDCLDAPGTDMSTVCYMLERSLEIKDQLNINSIICAYDQVKWLLLDSNPQPLNGSVFVYELSGCAFESSWNHLKFRFRACFEQGVPWHSGKYRVWIHSKTRTWHDKNILFFLMIGTFRIILTFREVLIARFKDAGLKDIVVQSMTVAEGFGDSMFSGTRFCNWALRIYKILYEALLRIFQNEFEVENPKITNIVHQKLGNTDDLFDSEQILASPELQQYTTNLQFSRAPFAKSVTLQSFGGASWIWSRFFSNLLYSTRAGKWNLYIEAVRNSLPLFCAYDRLNYSRYLTAHYYEPLALETNFPEILEEFPNENFSNQISTGNPSGRMEADKVKEITIDRGIKISGGKTAMFHLRKNQNTLRCRNYLWYKFLRNSLYLFWNLKLTIDPVTLFKGPVAAI